MGGAVVAVVAAVLLLYYCLSLRRKREVEPQGRRTAQVAEMQPMMMASPLLSVNEITCDLSS